MKNILFVIVAITTFFFNIENITAQSKFDSWPELKAFHKVMSQTFHPSEKGDLAPIKERIGEMVEKANALAASKVPAEFNTKPIIAAVSKLQKDSAKLQKTINNKADDKKITSDLNKLHDVFHRIVGLCKKEADHDHDNHDHQH
jgi:hypothetical protein